MIQSITNHDTELIKFMKEQKDIVAFMKTLTDTTMIY